MKRTVCLVCLILSALILLGGCAARQSQNPEDPLAPEQPLDPNGPGKPTGSQMPEEQPSDDTPSNPGDVIEPPTPSDPPEPVEPPEIAEPETYRILLTSDIHCTHLLEWYGTSYRERMQHWVDALLAEHEKEPFDLIVIMGDVSLDFWEHQGGGSYLNEGYSSTEEFVEDFVGQLPGNIPLFMLAGNHEQYANEDWVRLTGNERQGSYVLGDQLFLFLDTFRGELDPDYHHDGKYVGVDMDFVNEQLSLYPDKDVWLIAHYFDMEKESDEFRQLLKTNDRIRGLFQGHTHLTTPIALGKQYNDLVIAQTGNFAYTKDANIVGSFWGFRDLVITEDGAASRYIIAESEAVIDGKLTHVERSEIRVVEYE